MSTRIEAVRGLMACAALGLLSATLGCSGNDAADVSARYKWKSEWDLPFAGQGYTVTETVGKDGSPGHSIRLTESGKGSIPAVGRDMVIDLPGTRDVRIEIDPAVKKTTYAGLTFTTPCVVDILKDCTLVAHQQGVMATDADGNKWASQVVSVDGNQVVAFFKVTGALHKEKSNNASP